MSQCEYHTDITFIKGWRNRWHVSEVNVGYFPRNTRHFQYIQTVEQSLNTYIAVMYGSASAFEH